MPIPTYDQMLRPILVLAAAGSITRRSATEAMVSHFRLSEEERARLLPSGAATYAGNRTGWAMTFLTKGRLIQKIAPRTYAATDRGREFLRSHPDAIRLKDLEALEGWFEAWGEKGRRKKAAPDSQHLGPTETRTPVEILDDAVSSVHAEMRARLLEAILGQSAEFFERLVLDVLVAMGYGGSRNEAAMHLGKSGDEGIDGRINQDPLGLDQILVQAKRNAPSNLIDRRTIQAFIGSLAGQGVTKGVFITTSSYQPSAREFVQRGSNTKIVLIDGDNLLDLMMRHKIGVRVERAVELLDLDQNYFEDND
jgi:restriction system protein